MIGLTPSGTLCCDAAFSRLVSHPNIVDPVTQLLGGPSYVFQLVLNFKRAFTGDAWPWFNLLAAFDVIFVTLSYVVFDLVLED